MIALPINFRVVTLVSIVLICIFVYLSFIQESKPKENYTSVTGTIVLLDTKYHEFPRRNVGKFRYLMLDSSPYIFELFTGTDAGDFSPKLNRVDELKRGDKITVYELETNNINQDDVNRNIMFIDKDGISYFEKGSSKKLLGIIMILLCIGLITFCYIMWKKGKMN